MWRGMKFLGSKQHGYTVYGPEGEYRGKVYRDNPSPLWAASFRGTEVTTPNAWVAISGSDTRARITPATFRTRAEAAQMLSAVTEVEALATIHYTEATRDSQTYSVSDYETSRNALLQAITGLYADVPALDVYQTWINNGDAIIDAVNHMRQERLDAIAAEAEAAAEEEAQTPQRSVTLTVAPHVEGRTKLTMLTVSPDLPDKAVKGITPAGVPWGEVEVSYSTPQAAWRMVDVIAKQYADPRNALWALYTVTTEGERPTDTYAGTLYATHTKPLVPTTYRAAGYPSLDAANGAGYANR